MPQKPPFYPQETEYSCAPACLRMVMAAFNFEVAEEEVRAKSNCDEDGTRATDLVGSAKVFGFGKTKSFRLGTDESLGYEELADVIRQGLYPIVFLKEFPSFSNVHAVIVVEILNDQVVLLDPLPERGERRIARGLFGLEWSKSLQTMIVVEK